MLGNLKMFLPTDITGAITIICVIIYLYFIFLSIAYLTDIYENSSVSVISIFTSFLLTSVLNLCVVGGIRVVIYWFSGC